MSFLWGAGSLLRLTPVRFDLRSSFIYCSGTFEKLYLLQDELQLSSYPENISQFTLNEPGGRLSPHSASAIFLHLSKSTQCDCRHPSTASAWVSVYYAHIGQVTCI